jgi:hypothetical protein
MVSSLPQSELPLSGNPAGVQYSSDTAAAFMHTASTILTARSHETHPWLHNSDGCSSVLDTLLDNIQHLSPQPPLPVSHSHRFNHSTNGRLTAATALPGAPLGVQI